MDWSETIVGWLSGQSGWAYHGDAPQAEEPAALTALALLAHGREAAGALSIGWSPQQNEDGSVGVETQQQSPGWPTAQAMLAWAWPIGIGPTEKSVTRGRSPAAPIGCWKRKGWPWREQAGHGPRFNAGRLGLGRGNAFLDRADRLGRAGLEVGRTGSASPHSRSGPAAGRSIAARGGLQFRQHVRPGTTAFAPSAIERHLPVGVGRRNDRRSADRPHRRLPRSVSFRAAPPPPRSVTACSAWPLTIGRWPMPSRCWPRPPSGCWSAIAAPTSWPCWPWPIEAADHPLTQAVVGAAAMTHETRPTKTRHARGRVRPIATGGPARIDRGCPLRLIAARRWSAAAWRCRLAGLSAGSRSAAAARQRLHRPQSALRRPAGANDSRRLACRGNRSEIAWPASGCCSSRIWSSRTARFRT